MISAEEFVALLEQKDLLSPELVTHLRRQIARPGSPISAALLAKWLVDRGHLSRLLAQRLLTRAEESAEAVTPPGGMQFDWEKTGEAEEDELGLAPLDDEIPGVSTPRKRKPQPAREPPKPRQPTEPRPPAAKPRRPAASPPGGSLLDEDLLSPGPSGPAAGGTGMMPVAPLDGLVDQAALGAPDTEAGPLAPVGSKRKRVFGRSGRRRLGRKRDNVWDSPLLLIGGGALLLLVIVGGVLYWALNRRTGDETFKMAEDFYRSGSYTKAIAQYTKFLEDFPNHDSVSLARVKRGLARLRQATDHATDWPKALDVAKQVLDEIAGEEAFHTEARPELVAMLPKIAQGLADRARADLDATLADQSEEALALVNKYVPASSRPATKLNDIQALLALTRREIASGVELASAVKAMNQAVKEKETARAYKVRSALLQKYPGLVDNERLQEAVRAVSKAELSLVKMVQKEQPAQESEPPTSTPATVSLATRRSDAPPPGSEGHVIFVLAPGVAYGLDAAEGRVLWRRPVGFHAGVQSPDFPPTPISNKAGSDAIMVDSERHEVLRVEAQSGKPRWRHRIGERFDAYPVVADERLLVATRSGRLVWIDLATGSSPGYIQFPQELRVGPTIDVPRSSMYQLAEHSNLFVLSLPDGEAKQVVYLGHSPGSVTVSPVVVNRYLIVAENNGVEHATLRVLSLEAEEDHQAPVRIVQNVRLKGHVDAPPQVSGVRMLVATDQGHLYVFEISGTDAEKPLALLAESTASGASDLADERAPEALIRFPLLEGGRVWIADSQLTWYDLQPAGRRLQPRGVKNARSATLQPLVAIGQTVFHVRRKVGLPGVQVSAIGPDQPEPFWETYLAAPLAAEPRVDAQSGQITAVTSIGAIFHIPTADLESPSTGGASNTPQRWSVRDQPTVALKPTEVPPPVTDVVVLRDRLLVMAAGTGQTRLPVFDPEEAHRFRWLFLPSAMGGHPIAFADGLLIPCEVGQVFLLDPLSGDKLTEPFQPALRGDTRAAWSRPALAGENELLLADGQMSLYRIGIKDQPKPHLAALAQVDLAEQLVSPLAVLGRMAYAVDRADSLVAFELPDLTPAKPRPLGAKPVWGPGRVGDHVLLATDDDQLYCLDAKGEIVWQVPLDYGPLAGTPLPIDAVLEAPKSTGTGTAIDAGKPVYWDATNRVVTLAATAGAKMGTTVTAAEDGDSHVDVQIMHYALAATSGVIWCVDPSTGKELAKVEIGYPLSTGPVQLGRQLLVGGHDGSLYEVETPYMAKMR